MYESGKDWRATYREILVKPRPNVAFSVTRTKNHRWMVQVLPLRTARYNLCMLRRVFSSGKHSFSVRIHPNEIGTKHRRTIDTSIGFVSTRYLEKYPGFNTDAFCSEMCMGANMLSWGVWLPGEYHEGNSIKCEKRTAHMCDSCEVSHLKDSRHSGVLPYVVKISVDFDAGTISFAGGCLDVGVVFKNVKKGRDVLIPCICVQYPEHSYEWISAL